MSRGPGRRPVVTSAAGRCGPDVSCGPGRRRVATRSGATRIATVCTAAGDHLEEVAADPEQHDEADDADHLLPE
ncbi:MAG: hypothetical protein M3N28_10560 [Actinomycetota bacterium]|nr:hypothetical protein [Actinomycetota bacterium]